MTHSIRMCSDDTNAKLQDCFASTDWNMFQDSPDGIDEYTSSVTGFINKYIDDVVPTVTVHTYPNQKSWITGNIRTKLKARAAAFKAGTLIRTLIRNLGMPSDKQSNRQSVNTGLYYTVFDARRMWQGLQTITNYKGKHNRELPSHTSIPNELNYFYAHFEVNNTETCMRAPAVPDDCVITLSIANVSKTFKQANIHKAAGPDGLPGLVLLACADQLAGFTDIFNMSLIECKTNMFHADHHSPCAQEHKGNLPK